MAEVDVYTQEAQKAVYKSGFVNGAQTLAFTTIIDGKTLDSVNSVYRFAKDVDANLVPLGMWVNTPGIASAKLDIGIYRPDGGKVYAAQALDKTLDIGSAAKGKAALTAIAVGDEQKTLRELASADNSVQAVDLGAKITGAALGNKKVTISALFLKA